MIRRLLAFGLAFGAAGAPGGGAAAQEACLRPVPPEAVRPPERDPELRGFLNDEYQTYLLDMQEYLNCLGREHASATAETNRVMARWLLWFGKDAVLHEDTRQAPDAGAISPGR